jgi:methionyl-tRNA formyltransferase
MYKKIVFMGTSYFAVPILKSLYQNGYPISVVYTQPPKKSNRGQKLNKSQINLFSENISLDVRTPQTLKNNNEEELYLRELKPDLIVVVSYGQIIPKNLLNIPKYGFLNIHASLLPKWRGAAPIQRSIMNLDKETGISIMKINENLDEGPVCNQYSIKISEKMNSEELSEKLSQLASEKILDILDNIYDGNIKFIDQEHSKATYAKKIQKVEGKINWDENADKIIGKINGLYPFPGAFFLFNGERYKILKAEKSHTKGKAGDIINEDFEICCGEGSVKVLTIQREGKRVQQINEFLLGTQIKKGVNIA